MTNCNIFNNNAPGVNNMVGGVYYDAGQYTTVTIDNATAIHNNNPSDCKGSLYSGKLWTSPACGRERSRP